MIGGAPVTDNFAKQIGADGYGADASHAVELFLYLVGKGPAPVAAGWAPRASRPARRSARTRSDVPRTLRSHAQLSR